MRKSKNLRSSKIEERKLAEKFIQEHPQKMLNAVLLNLSKAGIINNEGKLIVEEDVLVQYLSRLYEDVKENATSGNGKQEFVSAMIQIAMYYRVIHKVVAMSQDTGITETPVEERA